MGEKKVSIVKKPLRKIISLVDEKTRNTKKKAADSSAAFSQC